MRPQKVDDQQLMTGLMEVIRAKGFEGASMNDLAKATGLKKASLYHRFPGGKQEITEAVLTFTQAWGRSHISGVLTDSSVAPARRLKTAIENIRSLYRNGEAICVLRSLTMDPSLPLFNSQIGNSFQGWLDGFVQLGKDFGMDQILAQQRAIQALAWVQGSLVISKGLDDLTVFQGILKDIERLYID